MPTSDSYHDYLISRLKDPSYAALYLETHFELDESESPDPQLLRLALSHVAEALGSPDQIKVHQEKLDELLSKSGSDVIYNLGTWLQLLGLKLTVAVADDTKTESENSAATYQRLLHRLEELEDMLLGKAAETALKNSQFCGTETFTLTLQRLANGEA